MSQPHSKQLFKNPNQSQKKQTTMKQTVFAAAAFIAAVIILCLITPDAKSQVVKDAAGNYTISKKPVSDSASKTKTKTPPRDTGHTITDEEGKVYKVYEGSRGGLFYLKPGTDGTPKKIYIKK